MRYASLILAAGESRRLGAPKQLVEVGGRTLLERIVSASLSSQADETIVVLGAYRRECAKAIAELPVVVNFNENWRDGVAGSIRCGVEYVMSQKSTPDALAIVLCDQIAVSAEHLNNLFEAFERHSPLIVASSYGGTIGAPAVFGSSLYGELSRLKGDTGARAILRARANDILTVELSGGEFDLDTPEDLRAVDA